MINQSADEYWSSFYEGWRKAKKVKLFTKTLPVTVKHSINTLPTISHINGRAIKTT